MYFVKCFSSISVFLFLICGCYFTSSWTGEFCELAILVYMVVVGLCSDVWFYVMIAVPVLGPEDTEQIQCGHFEEVVYEQD